MNAAELAAEIAKQYTCVQGLFAAYCQTRERYVSIGFEGWTASRGRYPCAPLEVDLMSGPPIEGVIREFAPARCYEKEAEACEDFMKAFNLYAERWWMKHGGLAKPTLYWRYQPPHIFWHQDGVPNGLGYVRTRLVLSNRQVVFPDQDAYHAWRTEQELADGRQRQPLEPADQEQRKATD